MSISVQLFKVHLLPVNYLLFNLQKKKNTLRKNPALFNRLFGLEKCCSIKPTLILLRCVYLPPCLEVISARG